MAMRTSDRAMEASASGDGGGSAAASAFSDLPALQALKRRYEAEKPLSGQRIGVFLSAGSHLSALIDTLGELGAEVRSIVDAIGQSAGGFDVASDVRPEACAPDLVIEAAFHALGWTGSGQVNAIIDEDAVAARLIHFGVAAESGQDGLAAGVDEALWRALGDRLPDLPGSFSALATGLSGLTESTAKGIERLHRMSGDAELMFPVFDVSYGRMSRPEIQRDHIASDALDALFVREALAMIELARNSAAHNAGVNRFPHALAELAQSIGAGGDQPTGQEIGQSGSGDMLVAGK